MEKKIDGKYEETRSIRNVIKRKNWSQRKWVADFESKEPFSSGNASRIYIHDSLQCIRKGTGAKDPL